MTRAPFATKGIFKNSVFRVLSHSHYEVSFRCSFPSILIYVWKALLSYCVICLQWYYKPALLYYILTVLHTTYLLRAEPLSEHIR